jgi:hypothetical protein
MVILFIDVGSHWKKNWIQSFWTVESKLEARGLTLRKQGVPFFMRHLIGMVILLVDLGSH